AKDITDRVRFEKEHKQIEAALSESEERYRNLFENIPLGIYRTTRDGRILMANPALLQMLGYSSFDELSSRNLETAEIEPTYTRRQFREMLEEKGEIKGLEAEWRRRDKTVIFVRENTKAIRSEDGALLYYEGTVEDITKRKQTEMALQAEQDHLSMFLN